jgi:hypothetical protein
MCGKDRDEKILAVITASSGITVQKLSACRMGKCWQKNPENPMIVLGITGKSCYTVGKG